MLAYPQMAAGGDIRPHRFVKVSTAANNTLLEADAGEFVIGVSQEGTKEAPGLNGASTLAAAAGDQMMFYPPGTDPLLEIGSGGATPGAHLKSDADGKGVITTTDKDAYGAIALEAAAAGELCRVLVMPGYKAA